MTTTADRIGNFVWDGNRDRLNWGTKSVEPDLIKVGPKGYIHGWIFVGAPGVGDRVHHPSHGEGTVSRVDEHGHAHVKFDSGKTRSFQSVAGDKKGLARRGELGNDKFTHHLNEGARANRRRDYEAAHRHYTAAAEATTHPKIKAEMEQRAAKAAAKIPGGRKPEPEPTEDRADDLVRRSVKPSDLTDGELKATDKEFARRAARVGRAGKVSAPHQAVKDEIARRAKAATAENPADRVQRDQGEIGKLTDAELAQAAKELYDRHLKIGIWGEEAGRMDALRSAVDNEKYVRENSDLKLALASTYPSAAPSYTDDELDRIRSRAQALARERGIEPDMISGYRATRVEQARRANSDPKNWTVDKLHIFGGTLEDQRKAEDSFRRLTAGVPPEKMAELKHIEIVEDLSGQRPEAIADMDMRTHEMRVKTAYFNDEIANTESDRLENNGWWSRTGMSGLDRTICHELGHYFDSLLTITQRNKMMESVSRDLGGDFAAPAAGNMHFMRADDLVNSNKSAITVGISSYGATNSFELVAESWAAFYGRKATGATEQTGITRAVAKGLFPDNPEVWS